MANYENQIRTYLKKDVVYFRTTTGEYGPLSNMAPDFPILIINVRVQTAEALYQACRFPNYPDIQRLIIDQPSPMTAKMKSKKYRDKTREDWDAVRINIMRWCLRAKLMQNWSRFGYVLEKTEQRAIVEESMKDSFWGAKPNDDGSLTGMNVLGRLLMELREQYSEIKLGKIDHITYPFISNFLLFDKKPDEILKPSDVHKQIQHSMNY